MSAADLSLVIPDYSLGEGVWFGLVLVFAVLLPGHALRRQFGLASGSLWHGGALACVLGVLWTSLLYFALAACHVQGCHVFLSPLPWGVWLVRVRRRPRMRSFRVLWRRPGRPILLGLLLAGLFAGGYFVRTASLVRMDETGLRLYGAFYSDKLTNMSPCAALRDGVPPAALRISGYRFPSHYFPHLFVAAFDVGAGIDYLDGFWFYVATFGVFVRSLAVLAFSRRVLRSPWLACLALALFGLWRFSPQDKTLDLSFALLLLAIDALDRYRVSRRCRWAVLAVGLIAAMPFYEVFTGAAALGGLVVWSAASLFAARGETVLRMAIAVAAIVGAMLAVRLLYFGSLLASPPELAFKNVYLESYKHEWRDRLREPDPPVWMARIYAWKRGKAISDVADLPGVEPPGKLEEISGEVIYFVGFIGYFVLRFVNVALFGAMALAARRRGGGWNMAMALVASIAVVGFAVPCVGGLGAYGRGPMVGDSQHLPSDDVRMDAACAGRHGNVRGGGPRVSESGVVVAAGDCCLAGVDHDGRLFREGEKLPPRAEGAARIACVSSDPRSCGGGCAPSVGCTI